MEAARGICNGIPRYNLALCLMARQRYDEARTGLEALLAVWLSQRKRGFVALCHVALVPVLAGQGDWPAYDHHLREASQLISQTGMVDIDIGQCAERAGALALAAGRHERARQTLELALRNWEQLGDQERVDAVSAQLEDLDLA